MAEAALGQLTHIEPDYKDIDEDRLAREFIRLGAPQWVQKNCVVDSYEEPYSVELTAQNIGARILRLPLKQQGITAVSREGEWVIKISDAVRPGSHADFFVIGHEIGHIFLYEWFIKHSAPEQFHQYVNSVRNNSDSEVSKKTEAFCDYFSLRMLDATY